MFYVPLLLGQSLFWPIEEVGWWVSTQLAFGLSLPAAHRNEVGEPLGLAQRSAQAV